MKFENVRVFNFEGALRGMRNPKNSWHLSDSTFGISSLEWYTDNIIPKIIDLYYPELSGKFAPDDMDQYDQLWNYYYDNCLIHIDEDCCEFAAIGPKDMKLAQLLIAGGSEHRKFLRQIEVSVDITAPLYWWKEFDTYKVGTVANSTSTMHKLTSKPITMDCFEIDDYQSLTWKNTTSNYSYGESYIKTLIDGLEGLRLKYLDTGDKKYWKELVRWLPEAWLQTRTVTMNYENLLSIYHQRKNHKLNEWSGKDKPEVQNFMGFIDRLPYANEFIKYAEDKNNETNN